jgi:hypothetical protein
MGRLALSWLDVHASGVDDPGAMHGTGRSVSTRICIHTYPSFEVEYDAPQASRACPLLTSFPIVILSPGRFLAFLAGPRMRQRHDGLEGRLLLAW